MTASDYGDNNWDVRVPHGNAGPLRKWFNRMSQGEWNWPIPYGGIGLDKSELLVRDLITWNLWPRADYSFTRSQSLHIAEQHWGKCSPEWKAVERAWYDAGVGGLSLCQWRFNPNTPVVVQEPIGGVMSEFVIVINPNNPEDVFDEVDYDWTAIPANWTFDYNEDESGFTVTSVNGDYSSKMVSVDLTYKLEGDPVTYYESHSFPIHFSDVCGSGAKPGRPTSIKVSAVSDEEVYPNPTDKHLIVEGSANGTIIQLFNVMGQEVHNSIVSKGIEIINTSQLQPGVYIISLTDAKGNKNTRRIVKQ